MNRRNLTNHQWEGLKDMIPGKAGDPGRTGNDNRLFLDAVLWMARTGALVGNAQPQSFKYFKPFKNS